MFLIYYSGVFPLLSVFWVLPGQRAREFMFSKERGEKMRKERRRKKKKSVNKKKVFFLSSFIFSFRFRYMFPSPSLPTHQTEDSVELVIAVALHPFNLPKSTSNHHRTSSFSRARQKSTRLKALQRPLPAPRAWPTGPRPCALPVG